jgi:hypothetical protein
VLHHQADLSAEPGGLAADVGEVLAAAGGHPLAVTGREVLTARVSVVARMRVEHPGGGAGSVVVKHVPAENYGAAHRDGWRQEFLEEAAAHTFLSRPDVGFTDRPALLGLHPNGALVLEDLGPEANPIVPLAEAEPRLALALARLHAATLGRGDAYRAQRARLRIDVDAPDGRYDGTTATAGRRAAGIDLLGTWATALGVADAPAVYALFEPVVGAVDAPGPWHACIHDDIANHRQCPTRGGRMLLLDFENARYAHALLDVAKVLVGKFERDLVAGDMVYACPGFEVSLAECYRRELAAAGGPAVGDGDWEAALADAVVYSVLVQIGMLVELVERTQVRGGLLANLATLFERLDTILGAADAARPELRALLTELRMRVTFGRGLSEGAPAVQREESPGMSAVQVIEAVYGASGGSLDATATVQSLVEGGTTSITPSNTLFGTDPSPQVVKNFTVIYRVGQTRYTAACGEGETVTLATTPGIVVLGAVFGASAGAEEVSAAVQALVNAGTIAIAATDANFGDPAPGSPKHFAVTWVSAAGTVQRASCAEGETVTLS